MVRGMSSSLAAGFCCILYVGCDMLAKGDGCWREEIAYHNIRLLYCEHYVQYWDACSIIGWERIWNQMQWSPHAYLNPTIVLLDVVYIVC